MEGFSFVVNRKEFLDALTKAQKWAPCDGSSGYFNIDGVFFDVTPLSVIVWRANGHALLKQEIEVEHIKPKVPDMPSTTEGDYAMHSKELAKIIEYIKKLKYENLLIEGLNTGSLCIQPWIGGINAHRQDVFFAEKILMEAEGSTKNGVREIYEKMVGNIFKGEGEYAIPVDALLEAMKAFPKKEKVNIDVLKSDVDYNPIGFRIWKGRIDVIVMLLSTTRASNI